MAYKDEILKEYFKFCETCGEKFYKKKYQSFKCWGARKFCSLGCRQYVYTPRPIKHKKQPKTKICEHCGKKYKVAGHWQYKQRKYCGAKCSALARDNSNKWSDRRRERASAKIKQRIEDGTFINPVYMPGVIEKMKETKRKNPIKYSNERLSDCSKRAADRIVNDTNRNLGNFKYGKWGHYYSDKIGRRVKYRSSYELKAYKILDADDNVTNYNPECLRIKYRFENKDLYYIPDILVTYKDGTKMLIEVKPAIAICNIRNVAKKESAVKYCTDNNIEHGYVYWTELELKGGEIHGK